MRHFINDIQITPRNLDDIGVVSNFDGNPEFLNVTVDTIILPREAYDLVQTHIAQAGLFEGIPYRIEVANVTMEYYIDLFSGVTVRPHEIEVKIKRRKSIDNFFERAEGSTFALLKEKGVYFPKYKAPYFVIPDNQAELILQLAVITYLMGKEIYQAALQVSEAGAALIEAATPIPGLSPVGPTVSYNIGAIIKAAAVLIAYLVYYALLLIALVDLAQQLFAVAFPRKRYLDGTYFKDLCQKSCEYFGYTFASTIFDEYPDFALIPVPLVKERPSIYNFPPGMEVPIMNNGIPSSSDTTVTVLQFFRALETMFNARTIVRGNEVRLERRDWLETQTQLQLLPALALQSQREDSFTFNTDEAWKRYYLHYRVDVQDTNTQDGELYDASDTELSTEPIGVIEHPDLVTIKGLNDVDIPFALARRKGELTFVEKLAAELLATMDAVANVFGGNSNMAAQVLDRKNAFRVSQSYFSVTKVLYGKLSSVRPNEIIQEESYLETINANTIYNRYHAINQIQDNDYIIRENVRIRIQAQDFVSLLDNNYAEIDGVLCEILKLEWIDEKSFAQITYKEPNDWANGHVETLLIN